MSIKNGPGTVSSNLVFAYDVADTRNSYIGEPTTNLVLYSQNFDEWTGNLFGNWINSDITLNASYAPDGTLTSSRFGNGYSRYSKTISASTSTVYTFSVWLKNVSLTGSGVDLFYSFGLNGSLVSYGGSLNVSVAMLSTTEWRRFQITVTSPSSGINQMQFGVVPYIGYGYNTSGQKVDVWGGQVEQKSHATQYISTVGSTSTRSISQGLLDISGYNRTLNLDNISFDSNAQITFDGTNDYIYTSLFPSAPNNMSAEFVFYKTDGNNLNLSYQGFVPRFAIRSTGVNLYHSAGGQEGDVNFSSTIGINTYYHIVLTYDPTGKYQCYLNGVALTRSYTGNAANGVPGFVETSIGLAAGSEGYFKGTIPVARYYNKALSSSEIQQNYLAYKKRFGI